MPKTATAVRARAKASTKSGTAAVSETQSLTLTKNLLRAAVGEVCWARALFPPSSFRHGAHTKVGGIAVHTLKRVDGSVHGKTLHDIASSLDSTPMAVHLGRVLEEGVFQALEKRILRSMVFSIWNTADKEQVLGGTAHLLESYAFRITYPSQGRISISMERHGDEGSYTMDRVGEDAVGVVRNLVSLLHTLPPLPEARTATVRLILEDEEVDAKGKGVEDEWQPPHFEDGGGKSDAWDEEPEVFGLGSVATMHHGLNLKLGLAKATAEGASASPPPSTLPPSTLEDAVWELVLQTKDCTLSKLMKKLTAHPIPAIRDSCDRDALLASLESLASQGWLESVPSAAGHTNYKLLIANPSMFKLSRAPSSSPPPPSTPPKPSPIKHTPLPQPSSSPKPPPPPLPSKSPTSVARAMAAYVVHTLEEEGYDYVRVIDAMHLLRQHGEFGKVSKDIASKLCHRLEKEGYLGPTSNSGRPILRSTPQGQALLKRVAAWMPKKEEDEEEGEEDSVIVGTKRPRPGSK